MSFKSFLDRFWVGLVTIYTLYYIGYGWLPVSFTVDRVLKYYLNGYPLLGSPPLDLVVLVLLASLSVRVLRLDVEKYSVLASTYLLCYVAYAYTGIMQFLILYSTSNLYMLYKYSRTYGFVRLVVDSSYTIMFLELAALISASSYFAFGGWVFPFFDIVLRERFFWGFLEYASIPLLLASGISWLYSIFKGLEHPFYKLLNYSSEGSRSSIGFGGWLLTFPLLLVCLCVTLPHLPTVNPTFEPVSVDTFYYMRFLKYAEAYGLEDALKVFKGFARPLYLVGLYYASKIIDPILLLDLLHPIISLTLLALTSYVVVRRSWGVRAAFIASILTSLGHSSATFIAGGFQANSLALSFAILMLTVDPKEKFRLFILSLIVALIHPWTYFMFSASYLFYSWKIKRLSGWKILSVASILFLSLGISEVASFTLTSQSTSTAAMKPLVRSLGFYMFLNVFRGVEFWTWASQAYAPILVLSSLNPTLTIVSPVLALTSPLLLISSSLIVHRLILNLPLEIHASTLLEGLPRELIYLAVLSVAVRCLTILSGLTPLTGSLWRELLTIP